MRVCRLELGATLRLCAHGAVLWGASLFLRGVFSTTILSRQLLTFLGPFWGSHHGRSVIFAPEGSRGPPRAVPTARWQGVRADVRGSESGWAGDVYGA